MPSTDLLSHVVTGLPGKGSGRTVVQVVHCTRASGSGKFSLHFNSRAVTSWWVLHPSEKASFCNSTKSLYEIEVTLVRGDFFAPPPPPKITRTMETPLPEEFCLCLEAVDLFLKLQTCPSA